MLSERGRHGKGDREPSIAVYFYSVFTWLVWFCSIIDSCNCGSFEIYPVTGRFFSLSLIDRILFLFPSFYLYPPFLHPSRRVKDGRKENGYSVRSSHSRVCASSLLVRGFFRILFVVISYEMGGGIFIWLRADSVAMENRPIGFFPSFPSLHTWLFPPAYFTS